MSLIRQLELPADAGDLRNTVELLLRDHFGGDITIEPNVVGVTISAFMQVSGRSAAIIIVDSDRHPAAIQAAERWSDYSEPDVDVHASLGLAACPPMPPPKAKRLASRS